MFQRLMCKGNACSTAGFNSDGVYLAWLLMLGFCILQGLPGARGDPGAPGPDGPEVRKVGQPRFCQQQRHPGNNISSVGDIQPNHKLTTDSS